MPSFLYFFFAFWHRGSLQLCNQRDERLLLECLFPVICVIFIPEDCVFFIELNWHFTCGYIHVEGEQSDCSDCLSTIWSVAILNVLLRDIWRPLIGLCIFCHSDMLPEQYTQCNKIAFANFVAAISCTNVNQFEFVWLITATKFCCGNNDFH